MSADKWSTNDILISVAVLIGIINTGLSSYTLQKTKKIYVFALINVIAFVSIFFFVFYKVEGFFFEVSPQRAKCLKEQVSRNNFGKPRGCACCGKGTTGGIPANYAEWLGESDSDTNAWFRPDFVKYVNTFSNGEECQSFNQPQYIKYI